MRLELLNFNLNLMKEVFKENDQNEGKINPKLFIKTLLLWLQSSQK